MADQIASLHTRTRSNSQDTIKVTTTAKSDLENSTNDTVTPHPVAATVWIHNDSFSRAEVLIVGDLFDSHQLVSTDLVEVVALRSETQVHDFETRNVESTDSNSASDKDAHTTGSHATVGTSKFKHNRFSVFDIDPRTKHLCNPVIVPAEIQKQHPSIQISITSHIANTFGFHNRSQVMVSLADRQACSASHIELSFKDTYLARSDMWRLVDNALVRKPVYVGQKVLFLGTIRTTIKSIHLGGRKVSAAYFSETTVPIFRSEAARYVLFIQMSREMWDFDSEGDGEILWNRVINGFLPDMFKRWSRLEVRHLVTIVMFGRLEYRPYDLATDDIGFKPYDDFFRVVVTDMASASWTIILNELKKHFRVFLRDISLQRITSQTMEGTTVNNEDTLFEGKIRGRVSTALKGNILEAINIASTQFARDYIDRDLIRTGISIVVITAGTGVYEVDRELLNLTSQNLTDNGIGIDIVCLSAMPLHSAPLFKYRAKQAGPAIHQQFSTPASVSPNLRKSVSRNPNLQPQASSLEPSSIGSTASRSLSRFASSIFSDEARQWCYGIPEWIDLSYWTATNSQSRNGSSSLPYLTATSQKSFTPRVRMYELQMMGVMEHGLANISIPYLSKSTRRRKSKASQNKRFHKSDSKDYQVVSDQKYALSSTSRFTEQQRGLLSIQAEYQGNVFLDMDDYDRHVFDSYEHFSSVRKPTTHLDEPEQTVVRNQDRSGASDVPARVPLKGLVPERGDSVTAIKAKSRPTASKSQESEARISRTISYALRGLAPPVRAMASTEVNVQPVQAQSLLGKRPVTPGDSSASIYSVKSSEHGVNSDAISTSGVESVLETSKIQDTPSQPISIKNPSRASLNREKLHKSSRNVIMIDQDQPTERNAIESAKITLESQAPNLTETLTDEEDASSLESFPASVPQDVLPYIRNVNAANPIKNHPNAASWFGRWQHLYPRQPKTARVKWRSLCTPAAVPLTTPDLPCHRSLAEDFESSSYTVTLDVQHDVAEVPRSHEGLLLDMISLRLAHGYQWITAQSPEDGSDTGQDPMPAIFLPEKIGKAGGSIYLSMGNIIQKLTLMKKNEVHVARYVRKLPDTKEEFPTSIEYHPNVRTILSQSYVLKDLQLKGFQERYPWESADRYLADAKKDWPEAIQKLRFWRARFVLIPVPPLSSAWKLAQSEETEEEIHLLGIRALTQMWQKQRYIPPSERKFKPSAARRKKDTNPLEVFFQTLNPSEIVATELDKLIGAEETGDSQATQLLPESELLERETSSLLKLAQAMQSEKGIEIKNRRWHFKLHYNCFHGEQFTNWILQNFKDVETRDEAVEFGNELMKHGLFKHVNGRHNFKDGHYFYSIEPDYRILRTDSRQSWFPTSRRSDRSVPATPITEPILKEPPVSARSRSGSIPSNENEKKSEGTTIRSYNEKKRMSVSLSKMIRIDVDIKKRSDRPEVINLHYDRLHNPENCYHLELAWLNVTSKLVEDAIVMWATQAEKYGLRLVEVPIAEASKVSENEPFRSPYRIVLVEPPPKKPLNGNTYFISTSFVPQNSPVVDIHMYQKQLLKRFNFVLDLEAASEFPSDVDIQYSWGNLEYQYTQFVHRTGVILAQITNEGDILLLANRLYNTRSASLKDAASKFDTKKESSNTKSHPHPAPPQTPASGLLALNVTQSSPTPSPLIRASADVYGTTRTTLSSGQPQSHFITPEQIKDELEDFCHSKSKLEAFYREVSLAAQQSNNKTGGTSSSALHPVPGPVPGPAIPTLSLPESVMGSVARNGRRTVSPSAGLVKSEGVGSEAQGMGGSPKRKATG